MAKKPTLHPYSDQQAFDRRFWTNTIYKNSSNLGVGAPGSGSGCSHAPSIAPTSA